MLLQRGHKEPVTEMAEEGILTVQESAIFSPFLKQKFSLQRRDFVVLIFRIGGPILKKKSNGLLSHRLTPQFQEDSSIFMLQERAAQDTVEKLQVMSGRCVQGVSPTGQARLHLNTRH
jgi:hypothetical protein